MSEAATPGAGASEVAIVRPSSNGARAPKPSMVILPGSLPVGQYIRDLWHHQDMLKVLSRRQILLRYRQTALGAVWVVLQPLLGAGVLSFVFGNIAKLPTDGVPTFIFTYTGMLAWSAFSGSLARAQGSMVSNAALVAKIFFPRVILPLSNALGTVIDFGVTLGVLLVLLFTAGLPPSWPILLVPVWLVLVVGLGTGLGSMLAALSVRYRDWGYITPLLIQLGLYASPVAYSVSAVPAKYQSIYYLNPLAAILEAFRWSLNGTPFPATGHLVYAIVVCVVVSLGGLLVLERMEARFADVI